MNRLCAPLLAAALLGASLSLPALAQSADKDPLRAVLLESKDKNRGVTVHTQGSSLSLIVVQLDEHYLIGRSNSSSRIVVRLDRIDAVSAAF